MGRKNKAKQQLESTENQNSTENYTEDDPLFPEHTKQASLALLYLLFFSMLMFTLPFLAFYGVRHYLELHYDLTVFEINCWSVLAAVICVNLVICLYVFKAFKDVKKEEKEELVNKKSE